MAILVLTLVGDDRAGLVQALADVVAAHGGNWERSELAELAGAFAGVVLVSVPDENRDALTDELGHLEGLTVTRHLGTAEAGPKPGEQLVFTVLGNDHPGIVRDVTRVIAGHGLSIARFTSRTLEAPMAGGILFEATATVRVAEGADVAAATAQLEELAGEIQVDLTVG